MVVEMMIVVVVMVILVMVDRCLMVVLKGMW